MRVRCVVPVTLLCAAASTIAQACSCVSFPGSEAAQVQAAVHYSALVGIVEITSVRYVSEVRSSSGAYLGLKDMSKPELVPRFPDDATTVGGQDLLIADFRPIEVWKRPAQPAGAVATSITWTACGVPFEVGQTVLLFAGPANYTGYMQTDSCGRTALKANAAGDIAVLNRRYPKLTPPNQRLERP
jgi:hypothetical protein